MVADAISCWHDTGIRDGNVGGCPDAVDRSRTPGVGRTNPSACKCTHHLFHGQSLQVSESLTDRLRVYVFVGI